MSQAGTVAMSGFNGIVTSGGREVTPETGVPSLVDIAKALAFQPRFAGHTRRWWSVADHSLFVAALQPEGFPRLKLAALLHDAHEALTGDVPSPFKTHGLQLIQRTLDARLMDEYFPGGRVEYMDAKEIVRNLDHRALCAEAFLFGPVMSYSAVKFYFGAGPQSDDIQVLTDGIGKTWAFGAAELDNGLQAKPIVAFVQEYHRLRDAIAAGRFT